jgi:hypothetical protein
MAKSMGKKGTICGPNTSAQTTSTPPTGMSKEDWEKLDRRERSTI